MPILQKITIILAILPFQSALGFAFPPLNNNNNNVRTFSPPSPLSCICINCSRVTNCKAYHFVESKHSQPHMSTSPDFTPRDGSPTIHVNIRTSRDEEEMGRIWAEHVKQTEIAETKKSKNDDGKLMGENKYDLSVKTTYEYDVVECQDYDEDMGIWVRNMPEEIRMANPDFVPS